jgi:hypothetical protein
VWCHVARKPWSLLSVSSCRVWIDSMPAPHSASSLLLHAGSCAVKRAWGCVSCTIHGRGDDPVCAAPVRLYLHRASSAKAARGESFGTVASAMRHCSASLKLPASTFCPPHPVGRQELLQVRPGFLLRCLRLSCSPCALLPQLCRLPCCIVACDIEQGGISVSCLTLLKHGAAATAAVRACWHRMCCR